MDSVSRHRSRVLSWHRLVVASWVKGQLSQNCAVIGDDTKMRTSDYEGDGTASLYVADIWMAQAARLAGAIRGGRADGLTSALDRQCATTTTASTEERFMARRSFAQLLTNACG